VLESAKDFTELMKNSRYAPGLAKAKTPREAVQAIAAAGYAGGESDYVDKVIRVMRGQGVNVDQPFSAPSSPTRNQGHMTPTLAYISGNIGPTSTGQHLDVKQVGGGEFATNALDQYVVVDDPELGRVPLGKTPITGTFASHTARGSHGIDYGLYSGTKVYVRNGARVISNTSTVHGDKVVIQLPDGRRFSFLHGKAT
jgi:hypothetical protein